MTGKSGLRFHTYIKRYDIPLNTCLIQHRAKNPRMLAVDVLKDQQFP